MIKKHSFAKKLCAAILSLLIIVGSIPISMALDEQETTVSVPEDVAPATPDEAGKPSKAGEPVGADGIEVTVNSGAKLASVGGDLYVRESGLTEITFEVAPGEELYGKVKTAYNDGAYEPDDLFVRVDSSDYKNKDEYAGAFSFSFNDAEKKLSVEFDLTKITVSEGSRTFALVVKESETETTVFEKDVNIVDTDGTTAGSFEYKVDGSTVDPSTWVNSDIDVSFDYDTDSVLVKSVKADDETVTDKSFTATEAKAYTVTVTDIFDQTKTSTTAELKIDKNNPTPMASHYYINAGKYTEINPSDNKWYNTDIDVAFCVKDAESDADTDSASVSVAQGIAAIKNGKVYINSDKLISFTVDKQPVEDIIIKFKDKAGNEGSCTIPKENFKIDKDPVAVEDIVFEFESAESTGDKFLNFLTFGLYSNEDIYVTVDLNDKGPAPITAFELKSNGTKLEPVSSENGKAKFLLHKDDAKDSESFDLKLSVRDAAGNTAKDAGNNTLNTIVFRNANVKTQIKKGDESIEEKLKNLGAFEIVISKLSPGFDEEAASFGGGFLVKNNEIPQEGGGTKTEKLISGAGTITMNTTEEITGIGKTVVTINGETIYEKDYSSEIEKKKTVEIKALLNTKELKGDGTPKYPDGEYTIEFVSTANSGKTSEPHTETVIINNGGPQLGEFDYNGHDVTKWTKDDVKVSFDVTSDVGIDTVTWNLNNGEEKGTATKGEDGKYSFTAAKYGTYKIVASDTFGNKCEEKETALLLIDKAQPVVVDGKFNLSTTEWTNQPVTVTFDVKDKPDGKCSGIASVVVGGATATKVSEGKYQFTADKYGSYSVVVTDNVGLSKTYSAEVKCFDDIKPTVKNVSFSTVNTEKQYGEYSNTAITVTVTVENTKNAQDDASPLTGITIYDNNQGKTALATATASDLTPDGEGLYSLSCVIDPKDVSADAIRHLSFEATDKAGNVVHNALNDSNVLVSMDNLNGKWFEVVSTIIKPDISDPAVSFTNSKGESSETCGSDVVYAGYGSVEATVTDSTSHIKTVKTYLIKDGENGKTVNVSENKITNLADFTPDTVETVSTDTQKVDEKTYTINIGDANNLPSRGTYYAVFVAENLSGNDLVKHKKIEVTNDPPRILGFNVVGTGITTVKNSSDTLIGAYAQNNVKVEVQFEADYNLDCGTTITLNYGYNNQFEAKNIKGSGVLTAEFDLPVYDAQYKLSATATDKLFTNDPAEVTLAGAANSKVNGSLEGFSDNFELIVWNQNNHIEKAKAFDMDFNYKSDARIYHSKSGDDAHGAITGEFKNEFSGIKSVSAIVKYQGGSDVIGPVNATMPAAQKNTEASLTVNVLSLGTGNYTITYTVTDYCGNNNTFSENFSIDSTAPHVEKVTYRESVVDQFLNFLTFGLYSNNSIIVDVTIKDNGPSFGLNTDAVSLANTSGGKITVNDNTLAHADANLAGTSATYSFTLNVGKDATDSDFSKFVITLKDAADNSNGSADTNRTFSSDFVVEGGGKTFTIGNLDSVTPFFDIVSTTNGADFNSMSFTQKDGSYVYPNNGDTTQGGRYFSGYPTMELTVTDTLSKLHSVKVFVNDQEVTPNADLWQGGVKLSSDGVFNNPNSGNAATPVSTVNVVLDTAEAHNASGAGTIVEGTNTVKVVAVSNNGEVRETQKTFVLDTQKPVITNFQFNGTSFSRYQNGSFNTGASGVVYTDYGFFFKDAPVNVTVTASDEFGADTTSGVKEIILFVRDADTNTEREFARHSGDDISYSDGSFRTTFVVPQGFKGHLRAYAIDNVYNNSDKDKIYAPENVVSETLGQHIANTGVEIKLPGTSHKDARGYNLYSNEIDISTVVHSNYAGIKTIEYIVNSPRDKRASDRIVLNVGTDGSIDQSVNSSKRYVENGATTNLVTEINKTIHVPNDSNGIELTIIVTDYAGHTTGSSGEYKSDKFSIDLNAPKLEIRYKSEPVNSVGGDNFFNTDRVAVVTITARNFNPDDWKPVISRLDLGAEPALSPGSLWSNYVVDEAGAATYEHVAEYTFHSDGKYSLDGSFTALCGREVKWNNPETFVIDQTKPEIRCELSSEASLRNGRYYNKTVTATITIIEHNFYDAAGYLDVPVSATASYNRTSPTVSWSSSGDTHTGTIVFDQDGDFSFSVACKDKATNEGQKQEQTLFTVDTKIKDQIVFERVADNHAYDNEIAPLISFFDNNFEDGTCELYRIPFGEKAQLVTDLIFSNGSGEGKNKVISYANFEKNFKNDGIYILKATISDLAGNTDSQQIMFSVNRFGSNFYIDDPATKALVQENPFTNTPIDIIVKEINVRATSDAKVQVVSDDASRELTKDSDYQQSASGGTSDKWYQCEYKVLSKNFEDEGNYTVTVTTTDKSFSANDGRTISNRTAYQQPEDEVAEGQQPEIRTCPVEFTVDKTAPIVTISGIDNSEYYEEPEKEVTVTCDDANITDENLVILLDGDELIKDEDYKVTTSAGTVETVFTINSDQKDGDRKLEVSVKDKAGNNSEEQVSEFQLGASFISRLLHYHLPLVIAGGCVILAGIAFAVFMNVRKRKKNGAE